MSDMKIAVLGAAGRMGQALTRVLIETPGCAVVAGLETKGSPAIGRDIGEVAGLAPLGVTITDDPLPAFAHVDGVLDFTAPSSTTAAFGAGATVMRGSSALATSTTSATTRRRAPAAWSTSEPVAPRLGSRQAETRRAHFWTTAASAAGAEP